MILHILPFFGDPTSFDRWLWLKRRLTRGPLKTLDAGCGSGTFTLYAAHWGNESLGLSHDERNQKVAEQRASRLNIKNAKFMQADLRHLESLQLGTFDQIICFETIEHIQNDKKLIKNLAALLKPGGRILLTTPYKHYRHLLGDKLSTTEDGGHVRWGYTHEELKALFNDVGIEIAVEEFISGFFCQQVTNLMRLLGKVNERFAWAAAFPLRIFHLADEPITRFFRYPHLSVAIVGIKKGNA